MELTLVKENWLDQLLRKVWKEYDIPIIGAKRNWIKKQWKSYIKKPTPRSEYRYDTFGLVFRLSWTPVKLGTRWENRLRASTESNILLLAQPGLSGFEKIDGGGNKDFMKFVIAPLFLIRSPGFLSHWEEHARHLEFLVETNPLRNTPF